MADERIESIGQALKGVFGDPAWLTRSAVGAMVAMVPYVGAVWLMGYSLHYQRYAAYGRADRLPEWQLAEPQLKTGLYAMVAGLVYTLPLTLVAVGVFAAIIFGVVLSAPATEEAAVISMIVGFVLGFAILMLFSVATGCILWPVYTHVQLYDRMGAAFELRRIFGLMRQHSQAYWTATWRSFALGALAALVGIVGMTIAMGGTLGLSLLALPFEAAIATWAMTSTPAQLVVTLLSGLLTVPLNLAIYRLWAGYARVAYDLQPQTAMETAE